MRELARDLGLPVAEKNDSQEICFVPNGDYAAFIDAYFREQGMERENTAEGELCPPTARCSGGMRGHITSQSGNAGASDRSGRTALCDRNRSRSAAGGGRPQRRLAAGILMARDVNWLSIAPIVRAPCAPR